MKPETLNIPCRKNTDLVDLSDVEPPCSLADIAEDLQADIATLQEITASIAARLESINDELCGRVLRIEEGICLAIEKRFEVLEGQILTLQKKPELRGEDP